MTLNLKVLKAKHGDALILSSNNANILIDGGPAGVYSDSLRPALLELKNRRIDLLMVSHIDADHIDGILDLAAELDEQKADRKPLLVDVREVWHNSFSDYIVDPKNDGEKLAALTSADNTSLVLSSVRQGRQLRKFLGKLNIRYNRGFENRLVLRGDGENKRTFGDINLTVLGPTTRELNKLKKKWKKDLKKILAKEGEAKLAAAKSIDKSISNMSSLVVLAESNGKTILLTGDGRSDKILRWLDEASLLDEDGTATFDILKIPHHGSRRNSNLKFFKRVKARNYVVSGDGKHGNPNPVILQWLFTAQPKRDYKVYLTYSPSELKLNKDFINHEQVNELEKILSDPLNLECIECVSADKKSIDIIF